MDTSTIQTLLTHANKSPLWLALFIAEFANWRDQAPPSDRHTYDSAALEVFLSSRDLLEQSRTLTYAALPLIFTLSAAHINSLLAVHAMPAVKMAMALATKHKALNEQRRAHNILSALQLSVGDPHSALHNALSAASIARELKNAETLVNALLNATLALTHIGLYQEAIEIAMRAEANYCLDAACTSDIALLLGNAAHAASTTGEHTVALMFSKRALDRLPTATETSAVARVNILTTQLKSAIELRQTPLIENTVRAVRELATSWPSQRMSLCHRFCEALYVGFSHQAYSFVLAELAIVRELAREHHDLFLEASHQLIQLSLSLGDESGVLMHVNHLVSATSAKQVASVEAKLGGIKSLLDATQPAFLLALSENRQIDLPPLAARDLLQRLAVASEISEDSTGKSVFRVGRLAYLLAREVRYSEHDAIVLEHAARLHDIGKLTLPTALIGKPHRLSVPEYEAMQAHAAAGCNLLRQCGHPFFEYAADISLYHHETWEGTGYPSRVSGDSIPEAARIVALCEAYDSFTHVRSYRDRFTHAEAVAHMSKCGGTHFDPSLTRTFVQLIERLHQRHGDRLDAFLVETAHIEGSGECDTSIDLSREVLAPLVATSLIEASASCSTA